MQKNKSWILAAMIAALWLVPGKNSHAQLFINEFVASNSNGIQDPDYEENTDWVEIYNDYTTALNLREFYLTDNLQNPDKWRIETDAIIPAGGYIIIWCDGRDTLLHASFKLAAEGEQIGLFSPTLNLQDTLSFIYQSTDISYGRRPGGSEEWAYFTEPTPGSENSTTSYSDRIENSVEFSHFGGIFSTPIMLSLSTYLEGTIHYTLDGSVPAVSSAVYSEPIYLNKTTIVRTRIFRDGMIPGPVSTNSYFIDSSLVGRKLPIVSIATDPENFWDPVTGIYVQDFKPEWEVPINIEFFENNGSDRAAFNELAGTKVNGLYSWQLPQKMLGIYFRNEYGQNKLEYPLMQDRQRTLYKSFALRASGSDWSYTLFRDGMIQNSTQLNTAVDIQGFRACIVFVNGEYLGIHNIREKVDDSYIEGNYNLKEGFFDLIENEDYVESGSLDEYLELKDLLAKDLSVRGNYVAVEQTMDIGTFTDYVITEIYSQNTSVNHNVMAWKPKGTGLWRWILMDLDRGFFNPESYPVSYYVSRTIWPLADLMGNTEYRAYFVQRLADHLYTSFNPIRMHKYIDGFANTIESEIPRHVERWLGATSSYGDAIPSVKYWNAEVEDLHEFVDMRPAYLLDDLRNYGINASVNLSLEAYPEQGGTILFNEMKITDPHWRGDYPVELPIRLEAKPKPGYHFSGWAENQKLTIISRKDSWKYLDNGSNPGTSWKNLAYIDASWIEGNGEFGYGDEDEETIINYGSGSSKYITSYFRKHFQLSAYQLDADLCLLGLLRDDGAIVYINGQEVVRSNMPDGAISYQTLSSVSSSGLDESSYHIVEIDPAVFREGENIIAAEVHQTSASSTDMSFDLELVLFFDNSSEYFSTNPGITFSLSGYKQLTAVFESDGSCIIPDTIASNLTLDTECSPYVTQGDVCILPGATLTIEPGVEIRMAENSNLFIQGKLLAKGSEAQRIVIQATQNSPEGQWGALCFHNTSEISELAYLTIRNASHGPDLSRDVAAISAFHANLRLDNLVIEEVNGNPIAARYSDIVLSNSRLHSDITGDLINVKYGHARIENCIFKGNDKPDTDAIDYDDIENGIIRNCIIGGFMGLNCDAVDIGEKARNIVIDSLYVYNVTDKGISVGQQSSVKVSNSLFINCNLGLGLKDSCRVEIERCTFFSNVIPVSCYEKNPGSAGGNALIRNSILSNSYASPLSCDSKSKLQAEYCLSDNAPISFGSDNYYGDPAFMSPEQADFELSSSSPGISAGEYKGQIIDLGAPLFPFAKSPELIISAIFYNPGNDDDRSEFVAILNPGEEVVDLYGYSLTKAVEYTFINHEYLAPGEKVFVVKDLSSPASLYYDGLSEQWFSGKLSNEGEVIELIHPSGILIDQVCYSPELPWPPTLEENHEVLAWVGGGVDNHFGYNWTSIPYTSVFDQVPESFAKPELSVYPNPSSGQITITSSPQKQTWISIFALTGEKILSVKTDSCGNAHLDLSNLGDGIYLLKSANCIRKIILAR
ncbi:MAG: CotH kinase family protein [Bacteroidales bacterium]|nr:CotH kinase family protein [Bacteroidales bacterium]